MMYLQLGSALRKTYALRPYPAPSSQIVVFAGVCGLKNSLIDEYSITEFAKSWDISFLPIFMLKGFPSRGSSSERKIPSLSSCSAYFQSILVNIVRSRCCSRLSREETFWRRGSNRIGSQS